MDLRVHKWLSYVDTLATTAHTRPAQRLELPRIPPGVVSHPGRPYHRERDRYQAAPRSVSARGPRMCRQGPPGWSSPIVPHTNHVEAPQDREHEMASNARRVAPMDPRATRSERSAPLPVPDVGLDSPVGGDWKIEFMMIGQLAARTGLSVRTLRFYADAGLLVEEGRSGSGYRVFGTEAVHRGRLIRTLRELAGLLRDPDFIATSHRMAAVGEVAGPAARAGVDPASAEALAVVERLESLSPKPLEDRGVVAERIAAFTDRRVGRYWTLVGIINGWAPTQAPDDIVETWEWCGRALRAHS